MAKVSLTIRVRDHVSNKFFFVLDRSSQIVVLMFTDNKVEMSADF